MSSKKFITKDSKTKVNLQYDSIEILNHNPLLYKVEKLGKYGIMTAEGKILKEIEYDSIGYPKDKEREINYTPGSDVITSTIGATGAEFKLFGKILIWAYIE